MTKKKKIILLIILILLVIGTITTIALSHREIYTNDISSFLWSDAENGLKGSYQEYYINHQSRPKAHSEVVVDVQHPFATSSNFYHNFESGIITQDEGYITWKVNVPQSGKYGIYLEYTQVVKQEVGSSTYLGKASDIERGIKIQNKYLFNECKNIKFSRVWQDDRKDNVFEKNSLGDEIRPSQIESPRLVKHFVNDWEKYSPEPFEFYLEAGENLITFESIKEPLIINKLSLKPTPEVKKFAEQKEIWEESGIEIAKDKKITVEAEYIYEKNTPVLIPLFDQSSPHFVPSIKGKNTRLNAIGIYSWRLPGYWLSYKVNAPSEGLYALTIKGKQDIKPSASVCRQILINNELQYQEASQFPLSASSDLNNYHLGSKKEPYLFYLREGENTVTFSVSLVNAGAVISKAKDLIAKLNKLYLETIKYVSVTPDFNRDYKIETVIPELKPNLEEYQEVMKQIVKEYKGGSGRLSVVNNLLHQTSRFIANPDTIIFELNSFQSNISALGTWILDESEQPFTMDSFTFHDPAMKSSRSKANFFETTWFEIKKFFISFAAKKSKRKNQSKQIKVWITSGRDNAQILRRLIDYKYNPEVNVDLELVNKDVLLRATISGKGPDIALTIPEGTPIDFAFRGSALDLTQFADFPTIKDRFRVSALTPLMFYQNNKWGCYALPEQQIFPVFFYRSDIFNDLGLSVPNTWDELDQVIQTLNASNYNFYVDSGNSTTTDLSQAAVTNAVNTGLFSTILYQNGGEFYNDDFTKSALTSEEALKSFNMYTNFFTAHKVPIKADFVNRFRSGEIAAGITDYNIYNTLTVFAPEIAGNWRIALVPSLDTTPQGQTVSSKSPAVSMILNNSKDKDTSWDFLKWWSSKETQILYARELETIMGSAARYTTANYKALEELSWPTKDLQIITKQLSRSRGIPQVPGGYMTTRQFNYAFLAVVRDGLNPYETIDEYVREIDIEITNKRKEFGIK